MAKAILTLIDGDEPDTFRLDTSYEGGFQVESHAHQHALLLVKHMNELAERRGDTQTTHATGTDPKAVAEMARVMDDAGIPAVVLPNAAMDAAMSAPMVRTLERLVGEFDDTAVAEGRVN